VGEFQPWHIVVIVIVAVLLFGPKKIPEIAKALGEGIRDFKKAFSEGLSTNEKPAIPEENHTPESTPAPKS